MEFMQGVVERVTSKTKDKAAGGKKGVSKVSLLLAYRMRRNC
jgi:hypothetical protein